MYADVVIIGGGLVGASLAAALCANPSTKALSIILIDPSPTLPPSFSSLWPPLSSPPRTSTLTPSTQSFLSEIGAWNLIPSSRIASVDSMIVWDTPNLQHSFMSSTGVLHFNASEINEQLLAYVIDNDTIRTSLYHALYQHINNASSCHLTILPTSVRSIHFPSSHNDDGDNDHEWPRIELANNSIVHARLLAACDGPKSRTRNLVNADWFSYDYQESAIVANVQIENNDNITNTTAYQRFLSTGPLALLPLSFDDDKSGSLANIVWSTTQAEARALVAASDTQFIDELNVALSSRDDDDTTRYYDQPSSRSPIAPYCTQLLGNRAAFPLHAGHASRYVIPEARTVLVGDAAHAVHPLAGQGVNLGFADARALTDCIASSAYEGRDFGGEHGAPLRKYEMIRMPANLTAIAGLHALRRMFSIRKPFKDFRRLGMSIVHGAKPVKNAILRLMR